jgi:PrsW family intramembrane metalloprotease
VVAFLVVLLLMDTFRLVRPAATASAIACGAAAAIVSLWLNQQMIHRLMSAALVGRYVAPLTEEAAKSTFIVALMMTARIGFLVDAAILGFATGTGFALVENIVYLGSIPEAGLVVWIVRGLGTAMLQGATTSVFAIIAKSILDREQDRLALAFAPGLGAAIMIHSAFNHRLLPPMAQTLVLLIVQPLLVLFVFQRSEQATRDWIGPGLDLDVGLLNLVNPKRSRLRGLDSTFTSCGRGCPVRSSPICSVFCASSWSCRSRRKRSSWHATPGSICRQTTISASHWPNVDTCRNPSEPSDSWRSNHSRSPAIRTGGTVICCDAGRQSEGVLLCLAITASGKTFV